MSVDVIHAVMGIVYLLTWACIGQMNVHHRKDSEVETNHHPHWSKAARASPSQDSLSSGANAARACEAHL